MAPAAPQVVFVHPVLGENGITFQFSTDPSPPRAPPAEAAGSHTADTRICHSAPPHLEALTGAWEWGGAPGSASGTAVPSGLQRILDAFRVFKVTHRGEVQGPSEFGVTTALAAQPQMVSGAHLVGAPLHQTGATATSPFPTAGTVFPASSTAAPPSLGHALPRLIHLQNQWGGTGAGNGKKRLLVTPMLCYQGHRATTRVDGSGR